MISIYAVTHYCKGNFAKIENFEMAMSDETQVWHCHHRLETHTSDGEKRLIELTPTELRALGMYYDRPPEELIFLTKSEHGRIHTPWNKGKKTGHLSESHKAKISTAMKGGNSGSFEKGHIPSNKGAHLSIETKELLSRKLKGRQAWNRGIPMSDEQKAKVSASRKGKGTGPRNLSDEERARRAEACRKLPKRQKGEFKHSEESIKKMSEAHKGNKAHCKPITVNGVTYASKKEAAKALGMSYIAFVKKYK